ncbi:hypothetical protein [Brevibacillus sp. 179-C9.3 HS]|uniref:hypothetical protein n=1 Tax=unclassified Brevibacillus TaxID=2684853 RepID=UPI00399FC37D
MHPVFERSTGHLIIEWYEKKKDSTASPTRHYFSAKPSTLQLHPKDPKRIVRATFIDKMPVWMEKYCKEYDFQSRQVTRFGEVGFWIANWNVYPSGNKPFSSPHIDGAVEQFVKRIPDFMEEQRERLLANRETIKQNLMHHPDAFEKFGLYYRSEELSGNGGCIVVEDVIPPSNGESDEDYRKRILKDGKLEQLINEIILPLPAPIDFATDNAAEAEELSEEVLDEEILIDDVLEEIIEDEELVIAILDFEEADEISEENYESENEGVELIQPDREGQIADVEIQIDDISGKDNDAGISPDNPGQDVSKGEAIQESTDTSLFEEQSALKETENDVTVVEANGKRDIEGQLALF